MPTTRRENVTQIIPPAEVPKHQQRPSLISIFTGTGMQSSMNPSIAHDNRSGTGTGTPSDITNQLHLPQESYSSSSTTPKEHPVSDSHSGDGTTPTPSIAAGSSMAMPGGNPLTQSFVPHLSHSMSLQQQVPLKTHAPKLRFVSSVEFRHSSGETSTTPLSPDSAAEYSSGELQRPSRLQRSKAQSRKTFRLRRGRQSNSEQISHLAMEHELPPVAKAVSTAAAADLSWDSVSQTSSTSGYRDNCSIQTGFLSPDGSLTGPPLGGRSSSQHSLLMLFEAQDEDTLI